MEADAALISTNGVVVLDSPASVDLDSAVLVNPRNIEGNNPVRLNETPEWCLLFTGRECVLCLPAVIVNVKLFLTFTITYIQSHFIRENLPGLLYPLFDCAFRDSQRLCDFQVLHVRISLQHQDQAAVQRHL